MPARGDTTSARRGEGASASRPDSIPQALEAIKRLLRDDPDGARRRAERLLGRARARANPGLTARILTQLARCHAMQTRFDQAETALAEAVGLLDATRHPLELAEALRLRGRYCSMTGQVREALSHLLAARTLFHRLEAREPLAQTLSYLGALHHMVGDYEKALEYHLEALSLSEQDRSSAALPDVLRHLAWTWLELAEADRAVGCLERCLELYRDRGEVYGQFHTLCALGSAHRNLKALDRAQVLLEEARALIEHSNPALLPGVLLELGRILQERGDFDGSLEPLRESLRLFQEAGATLYAGMASNDLGASLLSQGRLEEARETLEQAYRLTVQCGDRGVECDTSAKLARVCELQGRTGEALAWMKRAYTLREEILGQANQRRISAVQLRFEAQKAAEEHQRLKEEQARLAREIEAKSSELSAAALCLGERHRLLEALRRDLRAALQGPDRGLRDAVDTLAREVEHTLRDGEDWDDFSRQFERLHGSFLVDLSRRFPSLTRTEVKVCSLLKLNMSTKEIANVLHVSVRDIENHRYRLRKKLELPTSMNLRAFLSTL